jgi:hypothetical protein
MFVSVFKEFEYSSVLRAKVGVIGKHRPEREFEKRMERYPFSVYRGDAGGGKHDMFLLSDGTDIFKESGLTGSGFSG